MNDHRHNSSVVGGPGARGERRPGGVRSIPTSECWAEQARGASGNAAKTYALYSGVNAFAEGIKEDDNPFNALTEKKLFDEWRFGWRAASRGKKKTDEEKRDPRYWWEKL